MSQVITVVAALIVRDGRILIGQRRKNDAQGLKWEFPGGKLRVGESHESALMRELQEELGVTSTIGRLIHRTRHTYSELSRTLDLLFYAAELEDKSLVNRAFEQIAWAELSTLSSYDFLAADRDLIDFLASKKIVL
ncbi:MAG: (deoxy)nucleoside triphosphate pyrophosphohydrolase [Acidobacteria bacterium]|nr:(deoxy)nucleoside triphosphate pyrophosphohydrolase [Acidobacteriota bacterium]